MKILAIDTSSKNCSIALLEDTNLIAQKHIDDEKTHSQKLMPLIDEVLKKCKLTLNDLDLLSCSIGPGSFTGVRIGVSTVKAFADVTNIPISPVSSLEGLAYNVLNSHYTTTNIVCSLIDAKNDNVYCGIFKRENDNFLSLEDFYAANINEVLENLSKYSFITFVGDGSNNYKYTILEKYPKSIFIEDDLNIQNSISIGKCAFYKYKNGIYGDSNYIVPLYLRKSQAERALEGEK